jgi:hypothetical protein
MAHNNPDVVRWWGYALLLLAASAGLGIGFNVAYLSEDVPWAGFVILFASGILLGFSVRNLWLLKR